VSSKLKVSRPLCLNVATLSSRFSTLYFELFTQAIQSRNQRLVLFWRANGDTQVVCNTFRLTKVTHDHTLLAQPPGKRCTAVLPMAGKEKIRRRRQALKAALRQLFIEPLALSDHLLAAFFKPRLILKRSSG